jgi:hypothetical protein
LHGKTGFLPIKKLRLPHSNMMSRFINAGCLKEPAFKKYFFFK